MSKSIELRKVSQEAWRDYLATCHEIDVEHHEELLEVFMTAPDLIRAALAHRDKRRATKRGGDVVEMGARGKVGM